MRMLGGKFLNGLSNRASSIALQFYRADHKTDERIYGPDNPDEMITVIFLDGWTGFERYEKCVDSACFGDYKTNK